MGTPTRFFVGSTSCEVAAKRKENMRLYLAYLLDPTDCNAHLLADGIGAHAAATERDTHLFQIDTTAGVDTAAKPVAAIAALMREMLATVINAAQVDPQYAFDIHLEYHIPQLAAMIEDATGRRIKYRGRVL